MKTKRIWKILCLALLIAVVTAGCGPAAAEGSPYAIPEKYDVRVLYPEWAENPESYPSVEEAEDIAAAREFEQLCYPYWKDDQARLDWLRSTYSWGYYSELLVDNTEFLEDEENLKIIAWLEAETKYLGGTLEVSIFEELGLKIEDYVVRK